MVLVIVFVLFIFLPALFPFAAGAFERKDYLERPQEVVRHVLGFQLLDFLADVAYAFAAQNAEDYQNQRQNGKSYN